MTITTEARPRVITGSRRDAVSALAWLEARRMLRHPAPWIGLLLSATFATTLLDQPWANAQYTGLVPSFTPLLLGICVASISAFGRERTAVSDDAPMEPATRSWARLLGGLSLVGLVGVVVVVVAVVLRVTGGFALGEEPGRTAHAYLSVPELLQPVLLAALAVALGAALVHVVRSRMVAAIVAFCYWFLTGATSWAFNGEVLRWLTSVQVQPLYVEIGPPTANPSSFPSTWLLAPPGQYQDHWARVVVSPSLAAWHGAYLVAVTMLLVAVAVPGRYRRPLAAVGICLAAGSVLMQWVVSP